MYSNRNSIFFLKIHLKKRPAFWRGVRLTKKLSALFLCSLFCRLLLGSLLYWLLLFCGYFLSHKNWEGKNKAIGNYCTREERMHGRADTTYFIARSYDHRKTFERKNYLKKIFTKKYIRKNYCIDSTSKNGLKYLLYNIKLSTSFFLYEQAIILLSVILNKKNYIYTK